MRKKNTILVQLPVPEASPRRGTGMTPLGLACLLLHAGRPEEVSLAPLELLRRGGDARLLDGLLGLAPEVLALSLEVWNVERSLALAAALRRELPDLEIWIGGPEVAGDAWFSLTPEASFDLAVTGEGEAAFAALIRGEDPDRIPGVWCAGRPSGGAATPLTDLASIHDPYLAGLVTPEADGVVLAELWRGCRYRCGFCAYPQGRRGHPPASRPDAQIEELFRWARAAEVREIYLLDPSLEQRPDLQGFLDRLAMLQGEVKIPLFAELRAEVVTPALAGSLARAGVAMVETGLQTLNRDALAALGRGLSPTRFAAGIKLLGDAGVRTKVDLMLGLPGDDAEGLDRTLDFLAKHGALGNLQVFRTQVLPGTPLRRDAGEMGIRWEGRPPYRILETPAWAEEDLAAAVSRVEEATGEALTTLPGPALTVPGPAPSSQVDYPDAAAVLQYSWDLSKPGAGAALDAETFRGAGAWVAVWLRTEDPAGDRPIIASAMRRLLAANPFSGLFVALELPPGAPLDPLFAVDEILDADRPSRYLEGLLDAGPRPERRLGMVLPMEARARLSEGWLDTVRGLAEMVWLLQARDGTWAARRGGGFLLWDREYLLLDLPPDAGLPNPDGFPDPYAVLISGTGRHWAWVEALERDAGTDF